MRPPNEVDAFRKSVTATLPQYRPMIRRAQATTHPAPSPSGTFNFFNAAMGGSGAPVRSDGGAAAGRTAVVSPLRNAVQGMGASALGTQATEATASGAAGRALAAPGMALFAGLDTGYHAFNTTVGGSVNVGAAGFDQAARFVKPDWIGISGNPMANDADGFTFDDIKDTYKTFWSEGVTAGQAYSTAVGRLVNQPFMGEEKDAEIEASSLEEFAKPGNERALYASNVGLYTEFDLFDETQRESAFNQGAGRWISGSVDAALAWWLGLDVLATRGLMAVGSRGKNLFTKSVEALSDYKMADELFAANQSYNAARAAGMTERQALDQGLGRTAYGQLTESLARMDGDKILRHDIARRSSDPTFVAKVLGDAKTPEAVHQRIMAMAGNRDAVRLLRTESEALADSLSLRAEHQARVTQMLESPAKGSDDIFTRVFYAPTLKNSQEEIARLDAVIAETRTNNPGLDTLLRGFEKNSDVAMQPLIRDLRAGENRSFEFAQKLEDKAMARAARMDESSLWTSTTFGSLGDGVGRAVRVIHSVGNYARTMRPSGWANFHNMPQVINEVDASLTTNPVLRRLARTKDKSPFAKYGDGSAWMPHVTTRLDDLQRTDPAAYQRLIDDPAAWDEWSKANRAQTAVQFREDVVQSLLAADTDIKRYGVINSLEERLFKSMAEYYGHDMDGAMRILERHHELRNNLVEQIKARGWYQNPDGYIDMLPELQSEIASGAPIMDFLFMDRVLRMESATRLGAEGTEKLPITSGFRASAAMQSARALSKFDSLWRPLVLLRVGYTLRNVTEGYIRELAYFNTLPGVKSAGRKGFSSLSEGERAMLGWASGSRSWGVDALERMGRRVSKSPWKTKKRLQSQFQAERNVLDRLYQQGQVTAKQAAQIGARIRSREAAAKRIADSRAAQEIIRTRQPGESVVFQQIEADANLRLSRLRETADEIIIDPAQVDSPFMWGRFADENAIIEDPNLELLRFSESGDGARGLFLERVGDDQYQIVHNLDEWLAENPADELMFLPQEKAGAIQAARQNVYGGKVDLRAASLRSNNPLEPNMDVTEYEDVFSRIFLTETVDIPAGHYTDVPWIGDEIGGFGRTKDTVGYVNVREISDLLPDNLATQVDNIHNGFGPNGLPSNADEVTGQLELFADESGWAFSPDHLKALQQSILDGTLDRPVIVNMTAGTYDDYYNGGENFHKMWIAPESLDIVMAERLIAKDSMRSIPKGIKAYNDERPMLPVVIKKYRVPTGHDVPAEKTRNYTWTYGGNGRYATSTGGSSSAPGYLWESPQLASIHPEYVFSPERVWNPSATYSGANTRRELTNYYPQFDEVSNSISNGASGAFGGYKAPVLFMYDTARAFAAARLDEKVAAQLTLRANWHQFPADFRSFIKSNGYLMPDEDFMNLLDSVMPTTEMTQADLMKGLRDVLDYQGSGSGGINPEYGTGRARPGGTWENTVIGIDTLLMNSGSVPESGMRISTNVGGGSRWQEYKKLIDGDQDEIAIKSYISAHQGSVADMGLTSGVGLSSGQNIVFDLRPGTPYGAFERYTGSASESEVLLPRGMRFRYKGQETVTGPGGHTTEQVHVFEAWHDPEAAKLSMGFGPASGLAPFYSPGDVVRLETKISGPLSEGGAGANGGFWELTVDGYPGTQPYYVKEYIDNAQAFAEGLADGLYGGVGATTRNRRLLTTKDGKLLYATRKEELGRRMGEFLDDPDVPQELKFDAVNKYFDHFGADVLLQNWDTPGRPTQGMTNLEVNQWEDGFIKNVVRADNGSVFMWKGMGGRKFDGDMDAMVNQTFLDMLEGNSGIRRLAEESDLSRDQIFSKYMMSLSATVDNVMMAGGPRAFVLDSYKKSMPRYDAELQGVMSDISDDVDMMAEYLERRMRFLLDNAEQEALARGFDPLYFENITKQRVKLESAIDGGTYEIPVKKFADGPIDLQAREMDNPLDVFNNDYMQKVAAHYGEDRGFGKVVVPDPNNWQKTKVMVVPSQVQVSNDLVDAARPGFLMDAAREQSTVLDLTNDPYEILESLGVTKIAEAVREGKALTQAERNQLAIAMQNSGYLTHAAVADGKILSGSELAGNPTMGAAFGAAVAPDLSTQIQARILNGDNKHARMVLERDELLNAKARIDTAVSEQQAKVQERINKIQSRMTSREQNAGELRRGGQNKEIITPRNGRAFLADGPISREEQGSLWMEETSSAGRVAADIGGLADASNRGLRRRTNTGAMIAPNNSMYWSELAIYANRRYANDIVGEGVLKMKTNDQIIDDLFNTNRGRAWLRDSEDFKQFKGIVSRDALGDGMREQMMQEINRRRQVLEEMFPDQAVRDALLDGDITPDFLRTKLGHRPDLKAFDGGSWEYADSAYRRLIGRAMEIAGTIPEDRLVRHPFFRNRWREEMTRQSEIYASQGVTEFTPEMIKAMSLAAKKHARQAVIDTLYTVQHVSTPAMAIRFLVPFFPAWASAARFWFKQVPMKHPENLVRYAQATEAPAKAGWVYEDGQQADGTSNTLLAGMKKLTGQQGGMITFQVPKGELKWLNSAIGDGMGTIKIPMGSLDMLLQGDFPLLPDAHPYVSVPVQWFASQKPDIVTELTNSMTIDGMKTAIEFGGYKHEIDIPSLEMGRLLTGKVLSFNDLTNEKTPLGVAREAVLPAWMDKFATMFAGTSDADFTATAQELLRNRQYNWALEDPETRGEEPTLARAIEDARDFWKFRGVLNLTLPFAPSFAAENQWLIDTWHNWEEDARANGLTYDEYLSSFLDQYGEEAIAFTKSKSGSAASSMGPTLGEYQVVQDFPELTGQIAKLGPQNNADFLAIFTRPFSTDEFDPNVWSWQMNREIPGTVGKVYRGGEPESLEDAIRVEKGWRQYNNVVTQIETLAKQGEYSDAEIKEAKRLAVNDIAAENRQWYEKYKLFNSGRWVTALTAVNTLLTDDKFSKTYNPPDTMDYADMNRGQQYYVALEEFQKARGWAVEQLAARKAEGGSDNIEAQKNADIATAYGMWLADIGSVNMDFRDMHQRYFQTDEVKPYEGVAR